MTFIQTLSKILPKNLLITGKEDCAPFECDGLSAYRQKPLVVVLPETIKQIKQILKVCRGFKVPVVTRGAGTGLAGGALPLENSLVLGLSKLNQILEIDPLRQIARVQPGVRNLAISEAVAQYGLYYAPDPSSQIACSIGGNVAENSGGVHCLKYGLTVHNVQAITVLNALGETVTFDYRDEGIDLLALLNGSEGLLGIIIEITLKLRPQVAKAQVIMAGFDQVEMAAKAVSEVLRQGIIPAGMEMMDHFAIKAAEDFAKAGYPTSAQALILCEIDGDERQVKQGIEQVLTIFKAAQASVLKVSQNEAERLNLWKGRKSAFPAVGRLSPDYYCMDGTIPRHQLAFVLAEIARLSKKYHLAVANVFHAGDGNLHPLILYDANQGELEKAEAFGAEILSLSLKVGGTITGEHGVGIEKLGGMCEQFSEAELATFHAIKAVFDKSELLNPGKAIPTLHRCAELGQMHVHHNQLPFPHIERF